MTKMVVDFVYFNRILFGFFLSTHLTKEEIKQNIHTKKNASHKKKKKKQKHSNKQK
tara:strand:+ start:8343 stop:8510 length:168 start_codon:yes stop_codon:yes gene_type:complete